MNDEKIYLPRLENYARRLRDNISESRRLIRRWQVELYQTETAIVSARERITRAERAAAARTAVAES